MPRFYRLFVSINEREDRVVRRRGALKCLLKFSVMRGEPEQWIRGWHVSRAHELVIAFLPWN